MALSDEPKAPRLDLDFQQQFAITFTKLNLLYKTLTNNSFLQSVEGFYKDEPMNYIISIRAYPFLVNKLYHNSYLSKLLIGGVEVTDVGFINILRNQKSVYKVGEYTFNANYDFINFSPFTKITCYLPYLSNVNLPVNECLGCTIEFYYSIDTYTGNATAFVYNATKNYVMLNVMGKIGIEINLGGNSAYERNRNLLTTGIGVMGGGLATASQNAWGVIGSAFKSGASIMDEMRETITRGSVGDGFTALANTQNVTMIIETPIINTIDYSEFKGRPLMETRVLNTLSGFTKCEDVHFTPLQTTPTSTEIDEIEDILRSGVIINL